MTAKAEPEWIAVLREFSKPSKDNPERSQVSAARLIGTSSSVVSQVLSGKYPGNLANIEARVRGALLDEKLTCPALGSINRKRCQDEQNRPFAVTNPYRVKVYVACRSGCPNSRHKKVTP
jgi:hypothetical protein